MKKKKEKKENPKWKKLKMIIMIILVIYIVINRIIGMFMTSQTSNNNTVSLATNEYSFVRVSECLSKYIAAINTKNPNDIIAIYSDKYKTENNITTDNVFSINNLSNVVSFKIEQLYSDNTYYYAYVTFYNQDENSNIEKSSQELTIQLYKNNTFAITPQIPENLVQGD